MLMWVTLAFQSPHQGPLVRLRDSRDTPGDKAIEEIEVGWRPYRAEQGMIPFQGQDSVATDVEGNHVLGVYKEEDQGHQAGHGDLIDGDVAVRD